MINRTEILELAREFSLRSNVIEKDYALGWLLAGIGQHPAIKAKWAFKGGTCLKKCYFETYRFSEDLDFTVIDPNHLNKEFLIQTFKEIAEWVYQRSGLELPIETHKFEIYKNLRGKPSVLGKVGYRGPVAPQSDLPRIKLDLTNDEVLVSSPVIRKVHHGYSDIPAEGINVLCYPYEEVFAEKVRALSDRELPRDLYDVIHLYRHPEMRPDRQKVIQILQEKCKFKNMPFPSLEGLKREPQRTELEREWANMLGHQLPALPLFKDFWDELALVFGWLTSNIQPAILKPIAFNADEDKGWAPPSVAQSWGTKVPLEIIRFAGANHLCVSIDYKKLDGTLRNNQIIEPYSLRRTQEGRIVLHALLANTKEHKSYRVERLMNAQATQETFIPTYAIELTPTGSVNVPLQRRSRRR